MRDNRINRRNREQQLERERRVERERREAAIAELRVNPDPRLVRLIDMALTEVSAKLRHDAQFKEWIVWADEWLGGRHIPQRCVDVSHACDKHEEPFVWPSLAQLAWGAKEACYSTPKSGWLVIRYVAGAMVNFGVAFPKDGLLLPDLSARSAVERPTSRDDVTPTS